MRMLAIVICAALLGAAASSADTWLPPKDWLAQALCVHAKEATWGANTGNGYYGGMQFMRQTWLTLGGAPDPAFKHPGDAAFPFTASRQEQLYRAWRLWKRDGGSWNSWGAVGRACSTK